MDNKNVSINDWFVVVNFNAGNRKISRDWPVINKALTKAGIKFDFAITQWPLHAIKLTGDALKKGFKKFISVGGDGTMNEIANALLNFEDFKTEDFILGLIPVGTGNDWGRMFFIPKKYNLAVNTIAAGHSFRQDVGLISFRNGNQNDSRYFLNIAGMGFDAMVAQKTNIQKAAGKGNALSYFINLLTSLFQYKPQIIQVEIDDDKYNFNTFSMSVGICRYNGGGMMQLPNAIPDDGLLDVTVIKKIGPGTIMAQLRNLYTGQFVKHPKVATFTAKKVKIQSKKNGFMMEADGESLGQAPFEITLKPRALKVIVGKKYLKIQ
ncbi:MAG TPA: diacylglycerol kinase family lipid kinase [Bacteroidales bacterium]|nr:diacylglycerol kinase family lipid kinase [Bacteroidales bacterium]